MPQPAIGLGNLANHSQQRSSTYNRETPKKAQFQNGWKLSFVHKDKSIYLCLWHPTRKAVLVLRNTQKTKASPKRKNAPNLHAVSKTRN